MLCHTSVHWLTEWIKAVTSPFMRQWHWWCEKGAIFLTAFKVSSLFKRPNRLHTGIVGLAYQERPLIRQYMILIWLSTAPVRSESGKNRAKSNPTLHDQTLDGEITFSCFPWQLMVNHAVVSVTVAFTPEADFRRCTVTQLYHHQKPSTPTQDRKEADCLLS